MSISHIQICYQLLQTHTPTHTFTPSLVQRRRRRILLPCFANAKPLQEAGNNNYLGANATTCRRQAIHMLVSIRPYLCLFIVGAAEGGERRQTNTPKAY